MANISEIFKLKSNYTEKIPANKNITFKIEKGFINRKRGRKTIRGNKKEHKLV